jgi:hypothetical protein
MKWGSAHADGEAGFQLEFFKWAVKLFETDNDFNVEGLSGSAQAYAKYFNVKTMKFVFVYNMPEKSMDSGLNVDGSNCKANQETNWEKKKAYSKTFFSVTMCYGLPKIASICGTASLSGSMGFRIGFGLVAPSYDALLLNVAPTASLSVSLSVSGNVLGFTGYVKGSLTMANVKVAAAANFEFKTSRKGGVYLGWGAEFLKVGIDAGVKFGIKCPKEMEATDLLAMWGKQIVAAHGSATPSTQLIQWASPKSELVQVNSQVNSQVASAVGLFGRRRRSRRRRGKSFWKKVRGAVKKVKRAVKKAVKVVKKVVDAIKCTNIYGPKKILNIKGYKLGGTVLDYNAVPKRVCKGTPGRGTLKRL